MNHIQIDNIDYIIARRQKDRKIELVDPSGRIRYVDSLDDAASWKNDRQMIPGSLSFSERDPSFIIALQKRRLDALLDNRKSKRQKSQSSAAKSRPSKRVSAPMKGALDHVPPHLRDQIALAMGKRRTK